MQQIISIDQSAYEDCHIEFHSQNIMEKQDNLHILLDKKWIQSVRPSTKFYDYFWK